MDWVAGFLGVRAVPGDRVHARCGHSGDGAEMSRVLLCVRDSLVFSFCVLVGVIVPIAFWWNEHPLILFLVPSILIVIGLWWMDARKYREWLSAWVLLACYVMAVGDGVAVAFLGRLMFLNWWGWF